VTLNESTEPVSATSTRSKLTKRRALIAAGVVVAVVLAGVVTANVTRTAQQAAIDDFEWPNLLAGIQWADPEMVASQYLTALIDRDLDAAASLRASTFVPPDGPIDGQLVGDPTVAEAIGLTVDVEILGHADMAPDDFGNYIGTLDPDRVDRTVVTYRVTYKLVAEGKPVTVSNIQALQLQRSSINAAGDTVDFPGPASDGPFTFGPWLVDTFPWRLDTGGLTVPAKITSNYQPKVFSNRPICSYPWLDFIVRSGIRRDDGTLDMECYAGEGSLVTADPDDFDYMVDNLSKLEDAELLSLISPRDNNIYGENPLAEFQFPVGDRTFIVTYLAVEPTVTPRGRIYSRIIAVTEVR